MRFEERVSEILDELTASQLNMPKVNTWADIQLDEYLDSVLFVTLVIRLEDEFNIEIDDEYLTMDNLANMSSILSMLEHKVGT